MIFHSFLYVYQRVTPAVPVSHLAPGLGLANGANGLVLRADRSKEPVEFVSPGGEFTEWIKKGH